MANSVKIKIDGDASGYKKTLDNIAKQTKAGMADVKAGIDLATGALQKLQSVAGKGISYNATLESLQTSFEVMTGSAEKAAEVVERLRRMGAETPFETQDLVSTTQLLMQYGFTADDAIEKMRMLGDIAQGNAQAMNSVALGYAQMSSAGKVNLVDIKQMINAGFNPLQEISERTGESMASLYDRISNGTMSVDEITQSMVHATSEGGRFFQSMEKQSQTLNGQLSTLKDNADQLLGSLTEGLNEGLRDELLPFANNMIGELQSAFETGGVQGLTDAATAMIPNLLDMMSGEFEEGIAAIGKWLPNGASALMKHVPQALRGASSVIPQITIALFEVATVVVTDLTGMLPELVPIVVEGFASMLGSALKGVEGLITGLFTGIEQAFHQGQTKIAGVWVDDSNIAKYTFEIDTDVEPATSAIEQAYASIRDALNTDLLTEEQRNEITGMIGEDYDAIYEKLKSFGLSDTDAAAIAGQVTEGSDKIKAEIDKLDVGVDSETVMKWMAQAGGSRIQLKASLKKAGLKDEDINEIIALYDTMTGKIKDGTPNIVEEIYNTLTDGKADDQQTVATLKGNISSYISELNSAVEEEYAKRNAALDTAAADYTTKKAELDAWYETTKGEIAGLNTEMGNLVNELAGAPTAVVQARMEEFAEVERQLLGIEEKIAELTEKARSAGEVAFNVVRSGAQADEATISQAISFKVTEFKLEEQSAEDAYNAAVEELNRQLDAGEIGKTQYNARMQTEASKLEDAKETARNAFNKAFGQIMQGIAESEGTTEALNQALQSIEAKASIHDFYENLFTEDGQIDTAKLSDLSEQLSTILGDAFNPETLQRYVETGDLIGLQDYLDTMSASIDALSAESLETALGGKIGEAWSAAIEAGVLTGTDMDVSGTEAQLSALLIAMSSGAAESAKPAVEETSKSVGTAATSAMGDAEGAAAAGDESVNGLISSLSAAERLALERGRAAGAAFTQGYKEAQQISSPSKTMIRMGRYSGEGLEIGLRESMERAVRVARQLSGEIVTAADFSSSIRVSNMPNLQQEIAVANEQSKTPVYLDGVQIAEIQGHNNSTQIAWNNTRAAKGVGSR